MAPVISISQAGTTRDSHLEALIAALCHFILIDDPRTRRMLWFGREGPGRKVLTVLETTGLVAAKVSASEEQGGHNAFLGTLDTFVYFDRIVRL